jgi:hypothetical protein
LYKQEKKCTECGFTKIIPLTQREVIFVGLQTNKLNQYQNCERCGSKKLEYIGGCSLFELNKELFREWCESEELSFSHGEDESFLAEYEYLNWIISAFASNYILPKKKIILIEALVTMYEDYSQLDDHKSKSIEYEIIALIKSFESDIKKRINDIEPYIKDVLLDEIFD